MSALDNPIWHSLMTRHSPLSIGGDVCRRYPPEVAPFVALADSSTAATQALLDLVQPGEHVGVLGVHPSSLDGWTVEKNFDVAQFVFEGPAGSGERDAEVVPLSQADIGKMLELTALVYPAYFRKGTAELGDYFGIFDGGRLASMAGIRMSFDGYQEISAVCTHPEHRGKGCASRLLHHLVDHIVAQGDTPFLHTEADNEAAQGIYRRAGFTVRRMLPFLVLNRVGA